MKILKGLLSSFLGFIMLLALTTMCTLFVFRSMLSGPNLGKIFTNVVKRTNTIDLGDFTNGDLDIDLKGIDKEFLEEDAMQVYGEMVSQMLQYEMGTRNSLPDTKELKTKLKEIATKYEKKTGEKVDTEALEKSIDEAMESYKNERKEHPMLDEQSKQVLGAVFSNGAVIACIIVFAICGLLIIVINKSFAPFFLHTGIVCFINGIGNGLIGAAIKGMSDINSDVGIVMLENVQGIFNKACIISIIVAVVSIVLYVILKLKKKNNNNQQPNDGMYNNYNQMPQNQMYNNQMDNQMYNNQMYDQNQMYNNGMYNDPNQMYNQNQMYNDGMNNGMYPNDQMNNQMYNDPNNGMYNDPNNQNYYNQDNNNNNNYYQ